MGTSTKIFAAAFTVWVAYLIGTSPTGVTPPHIPTVGSPMAEVPPWPVFRIAVALNDFFKAAAEATTLPKVRVIELATARWHSEVIYALTKNDVFEAIRDEPLTCVAVAANLKLNEPFTCRLLQAGVELDLLSADNGGKFTLTATSKQLLAGVEGSQRDFVTMINAPYNQQAWGAISDGKALKTGKSAFEAVHGESFWSYVTKRPKLEAEFGGAMTSFTAAAAASILSSYAFPPSGTICDVGGSEGGTLQLILEHYPDAKGVVFDRPSVVKAAAKKFEAAGLGGRARTVGGDFLKAMPKEELATCDVFLLKHILHDWSDAESISILKNVAAAGRPGATVAIVEHVLGVSGPGMERAKAMMDLNMMVSNPPGAKERSVGEYDALFAATGGLAAPSTVYKMRDILSLVESTIL